MKSEWEYTVVSLHSLTSLHERRFNKVHVPPLPLQKIRLASGIS
jgi:hypothetical protein